MRSESSIVSDPNFIRAQKWLDTKIETPWDLFRMWKVYGVHKTRDTPSVEKSYPWWKGLDLQQQ